MDKEQVKSILSAPISFVRESTPEEKKIFADKKMFEDKKDAWIYTFGLASGQQFIGCLPKGTEPYIDFRPVPEHNLLPEIKEIQWGYDSAIYFGSGPTPENRRLIKVIGPEGIPLQRQLEFLEECLGAQGPETLFNCSTRTRYVGIARGCDGNRRLAFSHPLREKALELKKHLQLREKALVKIKQCAIETNKAEESLKIAETGLKEILTPQKRGGVEVVSKIQQQKRR